MKKMITKSIMGSGAYRKLRKSLYALYEGDNKARAPRPGPDLPRRSVAGL